MLIQCEACKSKIRAPDEAAGRKVKCPKCAAVIQIPPAEPAKDANPDNSNKTRIGKKGEAKSTRLAGRPRRPEPAPIDAPPPQQMEEPPAPEVPEPPAQEPIESFEPPPQNEETPKPFGSMELDEPTPPEPEQLVEPEPEEPEIEEPVEIDGTEVTATKPTSTGKKPPPITKRAKHGGTFDDGDDPDEDEENETRKKKKRRKYDDQDDDDDDLPTGKRKRKRDDDDDDDDVDIRRRGRRGRGTPQASDGMAMTSMIMGLVSTVIALPGCCGCCWGTFSVVGGLCGIAAVICGFMNKSPSADGMALTGKITGFVGIALAIGGFVMVILWLTMRIGIAGAQWNPNF